jgi:glycosyltransferase involved in cell wall biosynthesis
MKDLAEARVAVMQEWLVRYAGSEQVVLAMLEALPQADLFTLVRDQEAMRGSPLEHVPSRSSFIQALPAAEKRYQSYLPLMPLAVEQLDLRPYDLVITSHHAVAKGVLTRADQLHVSYVHTPVRYAWDLYLDYLDNAGLSGSIKGWSARAILHYIRLWDAASASRVDYYLANSAYVARRVNKVYRRPARVVYPPVGVERYRADLPREDFYLAISRFVPYKRLDLIIETFSEMGKPLVVIGEGSDSEKARRLAGPNVELLGYQPDRVIVDHMQRARAFVFAAEEDFGIVPVEAQAAGCPVIAFGKGGALETVVGWPEPRATGVFFDAQTPQSLKGAVSIFETHEAEFSPQASRDNAERFGRTRFRSEFGEIVGTLWNRFQSGKQVEAPLE